MNQKEQFEKWYISELKGHPNNVAKDSQGNYAYLGAMFAAWEASQAATMKWQPIETAPKEGKELILLWVPAMGFGLMKWNGIWDDRVYNCDGPTHWMPLPPAPEASE